MLQEQQITPHVAQNKVGSAISSQTVADPGYSLSSKARKGVEEIFGWMKTVGLIHTTFPSAIFLRKLGYAAALGLLLGGASMVELIPKGVRCTGLALAYNISIGYFGGTTPLITTWLTVETGDPVAPAYWIAAAGTVGLITALFLIPETRFRPLARDCSSASSKGFSAQIQP